MASKLITAPATFPVTLVEAKAQCRIEGGDDDTRLNVLIAAATDYIEQLLGKAIITQTWETHYDEFSDAMILARGPAQSVVSVQYYDVDSALQTASAGLYTTDIISIPQWVVRLTAAVWPVTAVGINNVIISYTTGKAAADPSVKQAILLLIAQWYDNPTAASDRAVYELPNAIQALLANYRTVGF